jgi:hypothetical protein
MFVYVWGARTLVPSRAVSAGEGELAVNRPTCALINQKCVAITSQNSFYNAPPPPLTPHLQILVLC